MENKFTIKMIVIAKRPIHVDSIGPRHRKSWFEVGFEALIKLWYEL
jgi:hypothetical protein